MLLDSFSHSHLSQSTESQSFIRGFAISSSRSAVQTLICRISHFVPRRSRLFCSHAKHLACSLLLIWMIAVLMMMRTIRIDKLMMTMMLIYNHDDDHEGYAGNNLKPQRSDNPSPIKHDRPLSVSTFISRTWWCAHTMYKLDLQRTLNYIF